MAADFFCMPHWSFYDMNFRSEWVKCTVFNMRNKIYIIKLLCDCQIKKIRWFSKDFQAFSQDFQAILKIFEDFQSSNESFQSSSKIFEYSLKLSEDHLKVIWMLLNIFRKVPKISDDCGMFLRKRQKIRR